MLRLLFLTILSPGIISGVWAQGREDTLYRAPERRWNFSGEGISLDSVNSWLRELGISPDSMQEFSGGLAEAIGWRAISSSVTKPPLWSVRGIEYALVFSANDHFSLQRDGFFHMLNISSGAELFGIPVRIENSILMDQQVGNSPSYRHIGRISADLNQWRNNRVAQTVSGLKRPGLSVDPGLLTELKDYLLAQVTERVLLDRRILENERNYKARLDSIEAGIRDTLTGEADKYQKYLDALVRIRAVYEQVYAAKNKYGDFLESRMRDGAVTHAGDMLEAMRQRSQLGQKAKDWSDTRLSPWKARYRRCMQAVGSIDYGVQSLSVSRFTAWGIPVRGLGVKAAGEGYNGQVFAGKLLGRRNVLLAYDPLLNNRNDWGEIYLLQVARKETDRAVTEITVQYANDFNHGTGRQQIAHPNNLVVSARSTMQAGERLSFEAELAYAAFLPVSDESPLYEAPSKLAGSVGARFALFRFLHLVSHAEYIGPRFFTFGNPYLIGDRWLADAGIEYGGKRVRIRLSGQYWESLGGTQAGQQLPRHTQRRWVADGQWRITQRFSMTASYRPVVLLSTDPAAQISGSGFEVDAYTVGLKWQERRKRQTTTLSLQMSNMKSLLTVADTTLRTGLLYGLLHGQVTWYDRHSLSLMSSTGFDSRGSIQDINMDISYMLQGDRVSLRSGVQLVRLPFDGLRYGFLAAASFPVLRAVSAGFQISCLAPATPVATLGGGLQYYGNCSVNYSINR